MDTPEKRKSLRLTMDFLLSVADDKSGTPLGLEAATHAAAIGFMLQDFEARLAAVRNGGTAEFKVSEVITVDPRSPEEKKAWRDASDLIAWEAFEAFCAARCERELKEATVAQP